MRRFPKFGEESEGAMLFRVEQKTGKRLPAPTYNQWKRGGMSPTLERVKILSDGLELSDEELLVLIKDLWALTPGKQA